MATIACDNAGALTANCGQTLELWMKPLLSRLMGSTDEVVRCELRGAIREFYMQSRAWREQIGPFDILEGEDLIWLSPVDAYSNVMWVHDVWVESPDRGTFHLKPMARRRTDGQEGEPRCYNVADPGVVRLWPTPDTSILQSLWLDVALVPAPDATRLPNFSSEHHFEAILEGAMARLQQMPNKPWTDAMAGSMLARSFRRRCMEFRALADQGSAKADAPWRFPPFA